MCVCGKASKSINQRALSRYEEYRKNREHAAEPLSITRSIYSKLKHTHTHTQKQQQKVGDHVKQKKTGTKYWSKYLQRPKNKYRNTYTEIDHAPQHND